MYLYKDNQNMMQVVYLIRSRFEYRRFGEILQICNNEKKKLIWCKYLKNFQIFIYLNLSKHLKFWTFLNLNLLKCCSLVGLTNACLPYVLEIVDSKIRRVILGMEKDDECRCILSLAQEFGSKMKTISYFW